MALYQLISFQLSPYYSSQGQWPVTTLCRQSPAEQGPSLPPGFPAVGPHIHPAPNLQGTTALSTRPTGTRQGPARSIPHPDKVLGMSWGHIGASTEPCWALGAAFSSRVPSCCIFLTPCVRLEHSLGARSVWVPFLPPALANKRRCPRVTARSLPSPAAPQDLGIWRSVSGAGLAHGASTGGAGWLPCRPRAPRAGDVSA